MTGKVLIALCVCLTAGCAMVSPPAHLPAGASVTVEEEEEWRGIAAAEDAEALDDLPRSWDEALTDARRAGFARRLIAEGALLAPAAGLARAEPAVGPYYCRVLRLGAHTPVARPWSESAQGFCFVGADGDQLSLTIEAGPRRIGGYLWEERDSRRLIFLGATSPRGVPIGRYGDDRAQDAAGLFERMGPFHYRLTLPGRSANGLTIVELRPAPPPPEP